MINVLINAYAVSPTWGSEPGVGWNWIINLAKECNVFVITESEWETDIIEAVKSLPQKDNIHFFFNPIPQYVRDMCWNQGNWKFYKYYRQWQKRSLSIAKEIISNHKIDIIHQLNMIGFREPGYLWKIKDIPYIWGPIGNMSPVPITYLNGSSTKDKAKQLLKNCISYIQARTGRVSKAIARADQIITVLEDSAKIIKHNYNVNNIIVMPETGLKVTKEILHLKDESDKLKLLWVGRFIPTKKLDLAIDILSKLENRTQFELHIVGWGNDTEEQRYKLLAKKLGVQDQCIWYGKIPNEKVQSLMKESDIFIFTSVLEGTPHVVLESISNNLPVICFDMCGQGVIVNDQVGWKIHVSSLPKAINKMIETLNELERNRNLIYLRSRNCEFRKPELSWEHKISQVIDIYKSLLCK